MGSDSLLAGMILAPVLLTWLVISIGLGTATQDTGLRKSPFGFWYNGGDQGGASSSRLARASNTEEAAFNNHLENIMGQWKDPKRKRKTVSAEEQLAHIEIFHQLISEVLQAKYDRIGSRSGLGRTQWMVPSLVTGNHGLERGGWRGDMEEKLPDMSEEGYQGLGEE